MTLIDGLAYTHYWKTAGVAAVCPVCLGQLAWLFQPNPRRWGLCEDCGIVCDAETEQCFQLEGE